jgi:Flp pilus assembly protein TadG
MLSAMKMKAVLSSTGKFARDTAGATAILFSLGTVVVMGSIAFGIDAANWFQTDRRLQTGTDLAAIAAASNQTLENYYDYAGNTLTSIATAELQRDGVDTSRLQVLEVNSPPSSGAYTGDNNAVEVITAQDVQIFFAGLFVNTTPQAHARAVARTMWVGNYCILTLDPTANGAVTFEGTASALLGCGIASNSTASDSIFATGSSVVQTTVVTAVGGISDGGNIDSDITPQPYSNPIQDPYAGLVAPAPAPCDHSGTYTVTPTQTVTLSPGVYCGNLELKGDVTFNPGTYVLDGADMVIASQANVYGDGVTFIFTDSSASATSGVLDIAGGASVDLTAASTGTYAGILFMQDPDMVSTVGSGTGEWIVNGDSSSNFEGVIYVPKSDIELAGNAAFNNGCIQVVSGTVTISGTFNVTQQCSDPNQKPIETLAVTLVE